MNQRHHFPAKIRTPMVMGILNLTPDSFYDGGKHQTSKEVLDHIEKMLQEGADIIDIGAVSTRPNAKEVPKEVEIQQLLSVIPEIVRTFPDILLSVDTYRSEVVKMMINEGVSMVNDISGGTFDMEMLQVIAKNDIPYVMMHIQGRPSNMQINPTYKNVTQEVQEFFINQLIKLKKLGKTNNIILDPGFGFGKTLDHNYILLKELAEFKKLGHPLLVGISRKSMINKIINSQPEGALNGTTTLNTIALLNGADILRVHDVKQAQEAIKITQFYKQYLK